ncbi:MAG TPA: SDR family oxidoreductase [Candidatus Cybelea sp.]|nr:SDR family oxidoreductase [Candidatus Cybelea sp.]
MKTAFVTGGTGFVGINLIDELNRQGWKVTALHRQSSDLTYIKRFTADLVEGSITDAVSLARAMPANVDAVFHVAGNTNFWSRRNAEQTRENVEGTRNVVAAALEKRAKRLIVTSSISAYGIQKGEITEATPSNAAQSWINYQRTKWLAEEEARKGIKAGLPAVIMNPGAIVGPYDFGGWSRIFQIIAEGKLPGVPPGGISCGHVREVVRAHIAAVERGKIGENYLLAGTGASYAEMFGIIGELVGKPVPKRLLPAPMLRIMAQAQAALAAITGKPPQLTPEMAATLAKSNLCPSRKAQAELGYRVVPLRTMLQDCYDWMVADGRLKRAA